MIHICNARGVLVCDHEGGCNSSLEVGVNVNPRDQNVRVVYLPVNGLQLPEYQQWEITPPSPITGQVKFFCPSHKGETKGS